MPMTTVAATITAGGNVTVNADLRQAQNGTNRGDTFTPSTDIDPAQDSITFPEHALQTGDIVTYDTNEHAATD